MVKPEKFDHLHLVYHFAVPLNAFFIIKDFSKSISLVLSRMHLSHIFPYHTIIKRSSIQVLVSSWVTIQRLSGTLRSLIVRSVLPGNMIIGREMSPHAAIFRTTGKCFFSQPDVLIVTNLKPF